MMENEAIVVRRWYALRVKPRHEKTVAHTLRGKGLEEYLPLYQARRRWSDRIKEVELPLFAGYVFCRMAIEQRAAVLSTPGVYSLVGFGGTPAAVPEEELLAVERMQKAGAAIGPWPFLKAGQRVRIESGPLEGLEGCLARSCSGWHVVVSVSLLQRSVAATVERSQIRVLEFSRDKKEVTAASMSIR